MVNIIKEELPIEESLKKIRTNMWVCKNYTDNYQWKHKKDW